MFFNRLYFFIFKSIIFLYRRKERINDGIPHDKNIFILFIFTEQIFPRCFRRGKMKTGQDARKLAVRLFRKRGRQISRAQPRFHMSDFDLLVKSGKRRGKRRRRIPMDKDIIRFFLFQYFFQSAKDAGSDVIQGLSAPHDIQIVIDGQLEKIHHLIEHFPMLRREADLRFYFGMRQKRLHDRSHLYRFRPRAENRHDFHRTTPFHKTN